MLFSTTASKPKLGLLLRILVFGSLTDNVRSQVFITPDGTYIDRITPPTGLSASCVKTFYQNITCAPTLTSVAAGNLLPNDTDLQVICVSSCLSSLQALQSTQRAQCSASDTITVNRKIYPGTYITDWLLDAYNYACLKNGAGNAYCLPQFVDWNENNDTAHLCDECNLGIWRERLESPFGWSDELHTQYASLTSSCGSPASWAIVPPTGTYALGEVTPTVTAATTSRAPVQTATCRSSYTIQASDSCQSISRRNQVSTFFLTSVNKLPAYCSMFPKAGTTICLPQTCPIYSVSPVDTCDRIAKAKGVTTQQLISWNPSLNSDCSNIRTMVNYQICVGPLGTTATTRTATYSTVQTSLFANPCLNPGAETITSCWDTNPPTGSTLDWPTVTWSGSSNTTAITSITVSGTPVPTLPLAPGTWSNCSDYDTYTEVATDLPYLTVANPNYCKMKANFWEIQLSDLTRWNPSLPAVVNATSLSSCIFQRGLRYCVAVGISSASSSTSSTRSTAIPSSVTSST